MKHIFRDKSRLVFTIGICVSFIAVAFSSAIGQSISEEEVMEEKPVKNNFKQRFFFPLALPEWFYKIFNYDWNYWSSSPNMYAIPEGNVGIGTTNPSEKLDVAGTVQMTGFKMPTGSTNGYVLMSDSSGTGTWTQLPSGEGIGGNGTINYLPKFIGGTTVGNSIVYESGGNVGIDTMNPSCTLEVNGNITYNATGGKGDNVHNWAGEGGASSPQVGVLGWVSGITYMTMTWMKLQNISVPTGGTYLVISHYRIKRLNTNKGFVKTKLSWNDSTEKETEARMIIEDGDYFNIGGSVSWVIEVESATVIEGLYYSYCPDGTTHHWFNDDNGVPRLIAVRLY